MYIYLYFKHELLRVSKSSIYIEFENLLALAISFLIRIFKEYYCESLANNGTQFVPMSMPMHLQKTQLPI